VNGHEFGTIYECENEEVLVIVDAVQNNRAFLFPAIYRYIAKHECVIWNSRLALHTDLETQRTQIQTDPFYKPGPCLIALLLEMQDEEQNMELVYPTGV
jgi:hypothetical protein